MDIALWTLNTLLAAVALGGMYHFLVVRRCSFSLWLSANTCSLLIMVFLIVSFVGASPLTMAVAAIMFLFGAEGLLIFGWRLHPSIILPQIMHAGMLTVNVLLWIRSHDITDLLSWIAGLGIGFVVRYFQRRSLRLRNDTAALARDPVIGRVFARMIRVNESDTKGIKQ